LAAALILLKAAGAAIGWGIQFQQPWFLAGMALVTTLFAANLWDWAPLVLPAGIAGAVASVHGRGRFTDALLMGALRDSVGGILLGAIRRHRDRLCAGA
jgi:suppressor for copper-sensitivity B